MSRSGYSDDLDNWAMIKWRGAVASSIRGKRGQEMLRDLLAALDAMPEKRLAAGVFQVDGEFCTLGVIAAKRGIDTSDIDPEDSESCEVIAPRLNVAEPLVKEIMYLNDESVSDWRWIDVEIQGPFHPEWTRPRQARVWAESAGERRWAYMREWVASQIKQEQS